MVKANDIKNSLIKQLKDKNADVEHFKNLIDDYIWYWKQEREMQRDIKKRGFTYEAVSASGKKFEKDNPSVKNAILYNKQKLAILKELGLTTDCVMNEDEDEL